MTIEVGRVEIGAEVEMPNCGCKGRRVVSDAPEHPELVAIDVPHQCHWRKRLRGRNLITVTQYLDPEYLVDYDPLLSALQATF